MRPTLPFRLARRELRAGLKGFWIFLACLTLGVAAIAASGSLTTAMRTAINDDSRAILGGDLEISQTYRPLDEDQIRFFETMGTVSHLSTLRAMAYPSDTEKGRSLIDLKVLDGPYPLYGEWILDPLLTREQALGLRDGQWGAVVDSTLLLKLHLSIGDPLMIGEGRFVIRAVIEKEPDAGVELMRLGPRVMIEEAALDSTGLVMPGTLIRHAYLLKIPPRLSDPTADTELGQRIRTAFPDAPWQIRDPGDAAPGVRRFLNVMASFLTIVGLSTLTIGGIGIAGAVRGFIESRVSTIAALKCLGASEGTVFSLYAIHIGFMVLLGVAAGLVLGGGGTMVTLAVMQDSLPLAATIDFYLGPLALAAAFGLMTSVVFSLGPLLRIRFIPATALFRMPQSLMTEPLPKRAVFIVAVAALFLCALIVLSADDLVLALSFVGGALATLALFRLTSGLLIAGARGLLRQPAMCRGRPALRLALGNASRIGSPALSIILSLGLGLTVLVAIVQIEVSLSRHIDTQLPHDAPAFFFLDIQKNQEEAFRKAVHSADSAATIDSAPMIRGRIVRLNDMPVSELRHVPETIRWAIGSDRGLTMADRPPPGGRIIAGEWWSADYAGPPLLSLDSNIAEGLGLKLHDRVTLNILGRELTATIVNLREIEWTSLNINFTFVLSQGTLSGAPYTILATVRMPSDPVREGIVEKAVTDALPNVSAIPIRNALLMVRTIIAETAKIVRAAAALTLVAGVLVLAGAVAAGQRRRIYETVVFKVLGAEIALLWRAFFIEFGLLGLSAGGVAIVVGCAAAWVILETRLLTPWTFAPGALLTVLAGCLLVSWLIGFFAVWQALRSKAAPYLHDE